MTVTIEHLNDEETVQRFRDLCEGMFLKGECYAFAIALHQGLGWPIVGLIDSDNAVRHALVRKPRSRLLYDARGPVTSRRVGAIFKLTSPYKLLPIEEQGLRDIRPIGEESIARARQMAEVLWPVLPWKNSLQARAQVFATELEILSRKHGLWIRATNPTQAPILTPEWGGEAGYILRVRDDGLYAIDRNP